MATQLPPLPSNYSPTPNSSPLSQAQGQPGGLGLAGVMSTISEIEQAIMKLPQQVPSAAPLAAQLISTLRQSLAGVLGQMAGGQQDAPQGPPGMSPPPSPTT